MPGEKRTGTKHKGSLLGPNSERLAKLRTAGGDRELGSTRFLNAKQINATAYGYTETRCLSGKAPRLYSAQAPGTWERDKNGGKEMEQKELKAVENVTDWKRKALERFENFETLRRRTLEEVWRVGEALDYVKRGLPHGDFLMWCANHGIGRRSAGRFIEIFKHFKIGQLVQFESVAEARRAIRKPKPEPEIIDAEIKEDQLPPAEKRLMEKDNLVRQAKLAEERAQEYELQLKEATQKIKHFESGEKVAEGFQQGVSVIEEAQAEVRRLKSKVVELEDREKDALMELAAYKRWAKRETKAKDREIKELKEQIEKLKEGEI